MKVRFYCESCGSEVGKSDAVCPSCGKSFAAVRCPQCGFSGKASAFARGCPVCGYLHENRAVPVAPEQAEGGTPAPRGEERGSRRGTARSQTGRRGRGLPPGFYRWAIVVLLVVLIGLTVLFLSRP
ncbi:MAG TPA: zinc ribbon domain-containing protein [Spirochaetia bacterium]|nr:zinc ribbon domain-containing protein [Spirochaetia bacterium]